MLPALQAHLHLDDGEFFDFLEFIEEHKMEIAGSFPLLWTCEPTPTEWHPKTKQEITTLQLICNRQQRCMPRSLLEEIGNFLQTADFWAEYRRGKMDVDIFYIPEERNHIQMETRLLKFFEDWMIRKVEKVGSYALMPRVEYVYELTRRKRKVNLIRLIPKREGPDTVKEYIQRFDFTFCQATLASTSTSMVGRATMVAYAEAYELLQTWVNAQETRKLARALGLVYNHSGDNIEQAAVLADTIRKRIAKYERRRFTILNKAELEQLARDADELSRRAAAAKVMGSRDAH